MEHRILHSRLIALVVGAGLAACVIAGVWFAFPAQSQAEDGKEYGYVYSGAKSSSIDFVEASLSEDSLIVFGSSEFSTPRKVVPQVPSQVFGTADYGLRLMLVGEAYDQSLWHAIALGAFEGAGIPRRQAAIIVTPGWFVDGGQGAETFATRFSYSLYRAFCENDNVPDEAKQHVRERLAGMGVDEVALNSAAPELPQDYLNRAALSALDDLKLRRDLVEVREKGMKQANAPGNEDGQTNDTGAGNAETEADVDRAAAAPSPRAQDGPDFEALRAEADAMGAERSTTNEWGLDDAFYTAQLEPVMDDLAGSRADETYTQTPEYDDLSCFLDIADACNIDVLVVLAPEMGPYYDLIGIDADTRAGCYERVRSIVSAHDSAQLADFSDREYEKYFLYDIVHFGWTGWVDVEEALYDFAKGTASNANGKAEG